MKIKNLSHEDFLNQLKGMDACISGIEYIKENQYSVKEFWGNSENKDYLYWYASKAGVDLKSIVLSAINIARINKLSKSSNDALLVSEKWANGDESVTKEDLEDAARAAARATARVADSAASAARSADSAASAAMAAVWADESAASAARAAVWAAVWVSAVLVDDKKIEIYRIIRSLIEIED